MGKRDRLVGVGLGAGLLGAVYLALKYAIRPATKERVPDSIAPAIFATKVLHTSLGAVVFHESGSGQPVVFLHNLGIGASSYEWSKVYPFFASDHRVLAPDLVGFGESSRPAGSLTAADHARSIAEFIRALTEQPVILVGSGLGAGFAVFTASQHPELVSRLVLMMPTGLSEFGANRLPLRSRMVSRMRLWSRFMYRNYQATTAAIRSSLQKHAVANPDAITDEILRVYTTCAQQAGAEHGMINLQAGRFSFDLEARLKMLTQPVHLLWAEKASFPPVDWAYRFQAMLPQSTLTVLPGCGTLAALECPALVTQAIRDQLTNELRVFKAS